MAENDLLTRLLDAGMTFTALTQARAEELVRDLVRAGAVQAEQAQEGVDELLARSRRNSEKVVEAVRNEIDERLDKLDLASREDLERMVQRFADVAATLFSQLSSDRARPSPEPARPPAAVTPAASDSPPAATTSSAARPAVKAAAKKAPAKKATAKKATAKKAPAKTATAKKAAAKKAPAKKSTAKKAPAKKATAKKSAAKKAPAKKAAGGKRAAGSGSSPT